MSECQGGCNAATVIGGTCLACGKVHDIRAGLRMLHSTLLSMSNPHNILLINTASRLVVNLLEAYEKDSELQCETEELYDRLINIIKCEPGWDSPEVGDPGIFKDVRSMIIDYKDLQRAFGAAKERANAKDINTKKNKT